MNNHIMNKNDETYNTHIFERNILNSKLFQPLIKIQYIFDEDIRKRPNSG